jgi:hypothetical protein
MDQYHIVHTQPLHAAAAAAAAAAKIENMMIRTTGHKNNNNNNNINNNDDNLSLIMQQTRAALTACPVAAIRIENKIGEATTNTSTSTSTSTSSSSASLWTDHDTIQQNQYLVPINRRESSNKNGKNHHHHHHYYDPPFPSPLFHDPSLDIYWIGYHSSRTFGATPYLVRGRHSKRSIRSSSSSSTTTTTSATTTTTTTFMDADNVHDTDHNDNYVWIMVDTPKYVKAAVDAVTSLTGPKGPKYHFLTHVDDVRTCMMYGVFVMCCAVCVAAVLFVAFSYLFLFVLFVFLPLLSSWICALGM